MGKTLHDRVRLKGRFAFFGVNRVQLALLATSTILGLILAVFQAWS